MREVLADPTRFGQLRSVHSSFTFPGDPNFLENNIRVKPDLDALGALGDAGWYCVRAILWAAGFHLPATATAIHGSATTNAAGVILSCAASLHWPDDGKFATFHCSFLSYLSMDLLAVGSRGTLHLSDLVGPLGDFIGPPSVKGSAAFTTASGFALPEREVVETEVPQEVHMVTEFARLVQGIRDCRAAPEGEWAEMSRKTQLVVDAVKASIDNGYQSVEIGK